MNEDELVPLFVPALVVILAQFEKEKGSALTRDEVIDLRDRASCVMVPKTTLPQMAESRGYEDIDPDACWKEWQVVRAQLSREPGES